VTGYDGATLPAAGLDGPYRKVGNNVGTVNRIEPNPRLTPQGACHP